MTNSVTDRLTSMFSLRLRGRMAVLLTPFLMATASCSDSEGEQDTDSSACEAGAESCPCAAESLCAAGLSCLSDVCVATGTGGQAGPGTGEQVGTSTGGQVGTSTGGQVGTSTGGTGGTSTPPVTADPEGPTILSLATSTTSLDENGTLIITIVATDPDGIDDLIGGGVIDPSTGATYGALVSSAAEGAYSLTLNWGTIGNTSPVVTTIDGTAQVFRVQLFDVAGHLTEQDVTITLQCSEEDRLACDDGVCVTLSTGSNCGECGRTCEGINNIDIVSQGCRSQSCTSLVNGEDGTLSCDDVCAAEGGRSCYDGSDLLGVDKAGFYGCDTGGIVDLATCSDVAPDSSCGLVCNCRLY